jgi:hypothetical protein
MQALEQWRGSAGIFLFHLCHADAIVWGEMIPHHNMGAQFFSARQFDKTPSQIALYILPDTLQQPSAFSNHYECGFSSSHFDRELDFLLPI